MWRLEATLKITERMFSHIIVHLQINIKMIIGVHQEIQTHIRDKVDQTLIKGHALLSQLTVNLIRLT
jgi:hypothetical protein